MNTIQTTTNEYKISLTTTNDVNLAQIKFSTSDYNVKKHRLSFIIPVTISDKEKTYSLTL